MAKASETAPKVKNPHPLLQQGTPPHDVEADHVAVFTVYRSTGGASAPKYVTTLPANTLEPGAVRAAVGGGDYQIKVLANGSTSGRPQGQVICATHFSFDGSPIIKTEPVPAPAAPPITPQSIVEQASSQLPTVMTAVGAVVTGVLGFVTEARQARAEEERRRREYEDAKIAKDKDERDRRDAKERLEAEERRAREQREAEDRRAEREQREQERREQDRRRDDERLQAQREEAQARADRERALMQQLLNRPDPNTALMNILLEKALNPPPPPPPPPPTGLTADQIIDTAQKLKAISEDGPEKMIGALMPLAGTPVGQVMLARIGAIAGLCPPPEQMGIGGGPQQQQPVIPPEPAPLPQIPEQATPEPPQPEFAPGPVTMN